MCPHLPGPGHHAAERQAGHQPQRLHPLLLLPEFCPQEPCGSPRPLPGAHSESVMGKDGMEKQRIWGAGRPAGLCICGMVSVHFCINAGWMGFCQRRPPWLFQAVRIGGGAHFYCPVRPVQHAGASSGAAGLIVLGGRMLITLVTGLCAPWTWPPRRSCLSPSAFCTCWAQPCC